MSKGKKQKIKLTPTIAQPLEGEVFDFAPAKPVAEPEASVPGVQLVDTKPSSEWVYAALPGLAAVLVYLNTLRGEFVYDDKRQIVRNLLIQDLSNFWTALSSDVWAFKAEAIGAASSNYWRPSFVFWMIFNFQLFGLKPLWWHVSNILTHAGVTLLAYFLLRRFDVSQLTAGAIALLFAAHPVHTESVAWISGSPDLIMALGVLGSLWFVKNLQMKQTPRDWALALLLFALALGAKEAAILFPLAVFALFWQPPKSEGNGLHWKQAALWATPFAALAFVYFLVRLAIIGQLTREQLDAPTPFEMLLSVPEIFCFYLRQTVFPLWIGPAYPLRAVTTDTIGVGNFIAPLLIAPLVLAALVWLARRTPLARLGLAIFLLFLAPAFNIGAFLREQAVHDRYLYLPLLGFLILVVPPLWEWLESRAKPLAYAVIAVVCALLAAQTARYNRAWLTPIGLFEAAVKADPSSALNHDSLAAEYTGARRWEDALNSYNQALALKRQTTSLAGRAQTLTELKRFDEAERDLLDITQGRVEVSSNYSLYQAYERLAITYERQNKLELAAKSLEEARKKLPQYAGAISDKIGIILVRAGRKDNAIAQLEAGKPYARKELLPESRSVFYHLGKLYAEAGKATEARGALQEYLALTANMQDPVTLQQRQDAAGMLQKLGG